MIGRTASGRSNVSRSLTHIAGVAYDSLNSVADDERPRVKKKPGSMIRLSDSRPQILGKMRSSHLEISMVRSYGMDKEDISMGPMAERNTCRPSPAAEVMAFHHCGPRIVGS